MSVLRLVEMKWDQDAFDYGPGKTIAEYEPTPAGLVAAVKLMLTLDQADLDVSHEIEKLRTVELCDEGLSCSCWHREITLQEAKAEMDRCAPYQAWKRTQRQIKKEKAVLASVLPPVQSGARRSSSI